MTEPTRRRAAWSVLAATAGAVSLAVAALAPASAQAPEENRWLTDLRIVNMAHGGGNHEVPQGTMFAYATAVERGADVLEMDLHITLDGHVVAIHDSTVDRTTDGTGCVVSKTLAEIKALDAAQTFVPDRGPVAGQPAEAYTYRGVRTGAVAPPEGFTADDFSIVTLEELFQELPNTWMLMELKPTEVYQSHDCPGFVESLPEEDRPDLIAETARLIADYDMTDKVMVASFIDEMMARFVSLAPDVDTSFPLGESVAVYAAYMAGTAPPNPLGHKAIQVPRSFGGIVLTEDLVTYARSHGLAVHFWTINNEAAMRELLDWGVDGLITDKVRLLDQVLTDRGDPRPAQPTPPVLPTTTTTTEPTTTTTAVDDTTSTTEAGPVGPESTTTVPAPEVVTVADPGPDDSPRGSGGETAADRAGQGSASGGPLPSTGSDPALLVLIGGALLFVGLAVVASTRLRWRSVGSTTE